MEKRQTYLRLAFELLNKFLSSYFIRFRNRRHNVISFYQPRESQQNWLRIGCAYFARSRK